MPLPDELRTALDSAVADIANVAGERWGGMLVGRRASWASSCPAGAALGAPGHRRARRSTAAARGLHAQGRRPAPAVRTIVATAEQLAG